jgi:CarD family transcriptional regulator
MARLDSTFQAGGGTVFQVGDKVVYPMHGAGVVEAVTKKEFLGEEKRYYILKFVLGDMQVMVPTDLAQERGIRLVAEPDEVARLRALLMGQKEKVLNDWNRRYRSNMEKIRSGEMLQVAQVVKNLEQRAREKGLSNGERKMLDNARQILCSELYLSLGMEGADAFLQEVMG